MSDPHMPRDPHDPGAPRGPNDPRHDPRRDRDANPYTRYIIAGAAVIVLILAVIVFTGTGTDVGEPIAGDPAVEEPGETGVTPQPADPDAAPADRDAAPADQAPADQDAQPVD